MGFLIDSNAVIDYLTAKIPDGGMVWMNNIINQGPVVSIVTKIEILGFDNKPETEALLTDFLNTCTIIPLSDAVTTETIQLRKLYKIRIPDAIIAASAKVTGLDLITRNITDFNKITGLKVVNPHII